jgi:hypothetical protein
MAVEKWADRFHISSEVLSKFRSFREHLCTRASLGRISLKGTAFNVIRRTTFCSVCSCLNGL